jgi:hypothetical protein
MGHIFSPSDFVVFWSEYPSLWYAVRQGYGEVFPKREHITSCFLFNQLQICPALDNFYIFRHLSTPFLSLGCYIDFSGFSASRVISAQEFFLYTTCVTVDTMAHPVTRPERWMQSSKLLIL